MRLNLTPEQRRVLGNALREAFDQPELAAMLLEECGQRLHMLVGLPAPFGPLVTEVVQQAEMRFFTDKLILGAAAWRPGDVALAQASSEWLSAPGRGAALSVSASLSQAAEGVANALEGLVKKANVFADIDVFLARLAAISTCVCRIEDLGSAGQAPQARGTGFLVGDDLVLTNKHVMECLPADCRQIGIRFDYRTLASGVAVREGYVVRGASESAWVASSEYADSDVRRDGVPPTANQLDYALLRIAEPVGLFAGGRAAVATSAQARGHLRLLAQAPSIQRGDTVYLLQHPQGWPLKLAAGTVLNGGPRYRVRHDAATHPGSSGSPCFNEGLELVALHHATDPGNPTRPEFNQAVPIGLIAADLISQQKL